jgi:mannose-6-phosphate isomerase-like protein (cupin superfamily)
MKKGDPIMVYKGEVIENPISGERITVLEAPGEENGDLLRFDWKLPPRFFIPEHIHRRQEERHEIASGTLRGRIGGREQDYGAGERIIAPAGVPHTWRNPSETEGLHIISELQPARGFDTLLETGFAIAQDLKNDRLRIPKHLLRAAILLDEAGDEFYPTGIPEPVWTALLSALARLGRLLGYDPRDPGKGNSQATKLMVAGLAGTVVLFALLRRRISAASRSARSLVFPRPC